MHVLKYSANDAYIICKKKKNQEFIISKLASPTDYYIFNACGLEFLAYIIVILNLKKKDIHCVVDFTYVQLVRECNCKSMFSR